MVALISSIMLLLTRVVSLLSRLEIKSVSKTKFKYFQCKGRLSFELFSAKKNKFDNLDGIQALKLYAAMQELQVKTLESPFSPEQILISMLHVLLILNYSMLAQELT